MSISLPYIETCLCTHIEVIHRIVINREVALVVIQIPILDSTVETELIFRLSLVVWLHTIITTIGVWSCCRRDDDVGIYEITHSLHLTVVTLVAEATPV